MSSTEPTPRKDNRSSRTLVARAGVRRSLRSNSRLGDDDMLGQDVLLSVVSDDTADQQQDESKERRWHSHCRFSGLVVDSRTNQLLPVAFDAKK